MKKLWSTTVVSKDVAADTIFHYHQVCRLLGNLLVNPFMLYFDSCRFC